MQKQLVIIGIFIMMLIAPRTGQAQLDIFIEFLAYEWEIIFGFEGEPRAREIDFAKYPFEEDDYGLYLPMEDLGMGHLVRTNVNFHLLNNADGVTGGFLQAKFSPSSRITIDGNRLELFEKIGFDDERKYSFTNFSFQWNRIRGKRFHFWWDIGISNAARDYDAWGGSFGLGTTIYIKKPISLQATSRWSYFEDGIEAIGFYDVRLQYHLKQFLIYGGMQRVGGEVDWTSWSVGTGIYF